MAVVALVGYAGWWAASRVQRSELAEGRGLIRVSADVERQTLARTVTTRGVIGFQGAQPLTAAGSGRVTALRVSTGTIVRPGRRVMEIQGRPMVAVEAARPFFRDLSEGDTGADVRWLQGILRRAGYLSFEPDGTFGSGTKAALESWQEDHGFPDPDGAFRVDDWLVSRWPCRVGQVMVRVGSFVSAGAELFVPTERTPSVSIELTPSDRLLVDRRDPAQVELAATDSTAEGTVTQVGVSPVPEEDGSVLYQGTVSIEGLLEAPEGTEVQVEIVVERAKDVLTVPVASLVSDRDGGAAVKVFHPDDSVATVSVEVGLSEGAWVEIVAGLAGDERVLVAEA